MDKEKAKLIKSVNKGTYKPVDRSGLHKPSMKSTKEKIADIAKKMKKK